MDTFTQFLLPFKETGSFDKIITDYLEDDDFLRKFYSFEDSIEGICQRLESYSNQRLDRKVLNETLLRQYDSSGINKIPEVVLRNINSLLRPGTFTVTAGHQLNIFGGPLYVIYKLISAINLSEKLNKLFPAYHFVPVYWMATEDHDIEEISSVCLYGNRFELKNDWKGISGSMPLQGMNEVVEKIKNAFGTSVHADELISIINNSYLNSSSLAEAARKWTTELLGKYGLVIIDGNEPLLKKNIKDILSDELLNRTSSSIILKTTGELEKRYQPQVNPREINLFYIGENFRERIVMENNNFRVLNTDIIFSREQIKAEIDSHPEKFSPNVVLRPLYQECVLPNITFIGGPAEIAYWLELKDLFEYHKVPMPVLLLRCCVLILENNIVNKLNKLSIKNTDIFLPADILVKNYILSLNHDQFSFQKINKLVSDEFVNLSKSVSEIDPTLVSSVESEKQKITGSLQALEEKTIRSLKKKNETEINKIRKIKEKLFPSGKLQERVDSILPYYLKSGRSFIDTLKDNLDPLKKEFIILVENQEND